jgi:hypothetical protein
MEVAVMATSVHIKARITPWDDQAFVRAFEQARDAVELEDDHADAPAAAAEVQRRLRAAGYALACVEVDRTVKEALEHTSHWTVSRDG